MWFACVFDRFPHSFSLRALTKAHLFDAVQNMHEKLLCEITDISRQEKCQLVFDFVFLFSPENVGVSKENRFPHFLIPPLVFKFLSISLFVVYRKKNVVGS